MGSEPRTIVVAYEEENMSPAEIAEDRGLELGAVKAALMQFSSKYRKDCGGEEEEEDNLNFTNDELRRANQVIVDLAMGAEDDNLRLRAATYIRDDKRGRKDIVKQVGGMNINILSLNQRMAQVREIAGNMGQKLLNSAKEKSINV